MRRIRVHEEEGQLTLVLLLVVLGLAALGVALVHVGAAADRHARAQLAADAAALAGAGALAGPGGPADPPAPAAGMASAALAASPTGAGAATDAARTWALRNLPDLPPTAVQVQVQGTRVTVTIRDPSVRDGAPDAVGDVLAVASAEVRRCPGHDEGDPGQPGTGQPGAGKPGAGQGDPVRGAAGASPLVPVGCAPARGGAGAPTGPPRVAVLVR